MATLGNAVSVSDYTTLISNVVQGITDSCLNYNKTLSLLPVSVTHVKATTGVSTTTDVYRGDTPASGTNTVKVVKDTTASLPNNEVRWTWKFVDDTENQFSISWDFTRSSSMLKSFTSTKVSTDLNTFLGRFFTIERGKPITANFLLQLTYYLSAFITAKVHRFALAPVVDPTGASSSGLTNVLLYDVDLDPLTIDADVGASTNIFSSQITSEVTSTLIDSLITKLLTLKSTYDKTSITASTSFTSSSSSSSCSSSSSSSCSSSSCSCSSSSSSSCFFIVYYNIG